MTDSENRGTSATSVSSSPCQLWISLAHNSVARSVVVSNGSALRGPTVCTPRPLTMRSPAARVAVNKASCACGKADPITIAAVVPAAMRRRQNAIAARCASAVSARRTSAGKMQRSSHSSSWPPP
ncbi:Uncharacterised protein [Mycobacteroides abscessus subsp. abscessus]|nr:Uncharacterised protein [Mycobacteroides abscessus subsp. abscessus]